MNKRKHTYYSNSVPKSLKKKKASLKKQIIKKQQQKLEYTKTQQAPLKKIIPLKNRKTRYFDNRNQSTWKIPTAIVLAGLLLFILVIPAVIVAMFGEGKQESIVTQEKEAEATVELDQSPISIAVMRQAKDTVEDIPLEEYVAGVVASEMPATFELEALKAQALAARTFTVNHLLHGDAEGNYDVTDTVNHQVFKNEQELKELWGKEFSDNMNKIKQAVQETEGQILTYNDAPINAAFFSTSNGYTENSEEYWDNEVSYLRSVESPWDVDSPKFLGRETFTIAQVEEALAIDLPKDAPLYIEMERTKSGRVSNIAIEDNNFTGREVREGLELKSSDFTVTQNNGHLIFTTEGFGHGVGMSQYGADGMAREGKTYEEIVKHYYQDVDISTINETAPTLVSK
ncbi:stage II sporulation protein D [Oceanobacillus sp. FSL K6-2867]|uniref:stage II sporulation protein D n=1 Tax=Oceanobacillus sp. FSL K6-2867 TaxID=2954748 RepID=UPI0030D9F3FC